MKLRDREALGGGFIRKAVRTSVNTDDFAQPTRTVTGKEAVLLAGGSVSKK